MRLEEKCELLYLRCKFEKVSEEFETIDKYFTPIEELDKITNSYYDLYDRINELESTN